MSRNTIEHSIKKRIADITTKAPLTEHNRMTDYNEIKGVFELTHGKLVNKSCFYTIIKRNADIGDKHDMILFMNKSQFRVAYEHITYIDEKNAIKSFINRWFNDSNINRQSDILCNKRRVPDIRQIQSVNLESFEVIGDYLCLVSAK